MTSKKIFAKGFSDEPDAKLPGSFYLGTKFGSFFMNLLSNDPATRVAYRKYLTADKWWSRNFMRYLGEKSDLPTPHQRRLMKAAITKLLRDHHATAADLQADLWYHEKNLYGMLGAGKQSAENLSYGDAVNRLLGPGKPLERVKLARVLRQEIPTAERAIARARAGKTMPLGDIMNAFGGESPVRLARPIVDWLKSRVRSVFANPAIVPAPIPTGPSTHSKDYPTAPAPTKGTAAPVSKPGTLEHRIRTWAHQQATLHAGDLAAKFGIDHEKAYHILHRAIAYTLARKIASGRRQSGTFNVGGKKLRISLARNK